MQMERALQWKTPAQHVSSCLDLLIQWPEQLLTTKYNLLNYTFIYWILVIVPRSAPRNIRVYDPTTNTLSVSWEHAVGPVQQYRISYAPTTGDPIEEFVSVNL